jgi:hypothetical protein
MSRNAQSQRMINEGGNFFSAQQKKWPNEVVKYKDYPFQMVRPLPMGCFSRDEVIRSVSLDDLSRHLDQVILERPEDYNPQNLVGSAAERVVQEYVISSGGCMVDFANIESSRFAKGFLFSQKGGSVLVSKQESVSRTGKPSYNVFTDYDACGVMHDGNGVIPVIFEVKTGRAQSAEQHMSKYLQPENLGEKIEPILSLYETKRAICVLFVLPEMISAESPLQRHFQENGGIILPLPFVSGGHAVALAKRRIAFAQQQKAIL